MRSLCFFLIMGLLPLPAQTSIDDSAKIEPAAPPEFDGVNPTPGQASAAISTNIDIPAPPLVAPRLDRFSTSPGTVREGFTYREGAKTVLTLNTPAINHLVCVIVSSDPEKLICGNIVFELGQQQQTGVLHIKWKGIAHDSQVTLKAYDPAHPETVLRTRLYLRVDPVQAALRAAAPE